jgi:hypothetical protein
MVSSLLTFKQQINLIIAGPFSVPSPVAGEPCERDRVLADAANSAFMSGLAKRKNKPAEMIGTSSLFSVNRCLVHLDDLSS